MLQHFDPTITLGTILDLLGAVAAAIAVIAIFKTKIDLLLDLHARELTALRLLITQHEELDDRRFTELGDRIFDLVASVQRLVGRSEVDKWKTE